VNVCVNVLLFMHEMRASYACMCACVCFLCVCIVRAYIFAVHNEYMFVCIVCLHNVHSCRIMRVNLRESTSCVSESESQRENEKS